MFLIYLNIWVAQNYRLPTESSLRSTVLQKIRCFLMEIGSIYNNYDKLRISWINLKKNLFNFT